MARHVGCRIYNSAALTIANNTLTPLTFDSERYDYDTMHSTVSNQGRITFTTAGIYIVGASIRWAAHATGHRQVNIQLNGGAYIANPAQMAITVAGIVTPQVVDMPYEFAAGDYVEFVVYQSSGGNLDVTAVGNSSPEAWAHRIG